MDLERNSTITCPKCGFIKKEEMPTDACAFFYECTNCHTVIRPKEGDCCVFCSYGSVACPSIQEKRNLKPENNKSVAMVLVGSTLSAIIASACCIGPAILLSVGAGSAWMSHISVIVAYRPYFIGLAILSLAFSFYKLYIAPTKCEIGKPCSTPQNLQIHRIVFWIVSITVIALLLFPWYSNKF